MYIFWVSFRGQTKLGPRPNRSPLGVQFKISDEHPHPFNMRSPPPTGSMLSSLVLWNYHQREGNRGDVQCQATWPEHFNRSEMNLSHVTKFQQGLGMALLPKATKEGEHRNQGNHKLFLNMRPPGHRVCLSRCSQLTPKLPLRWAWGLVEARHENY